MRTGSADLLVEVGSDCSGGRFILCPVMSASDANCHLFTSISIQLCMLSSVYWSRYGRVGFGEPLGRLSQSMAFGEMSAVDLLRSRLWGGLRAAVEKSNGWKC